MVRTKFNILKEDDRYKKEPLSDIAICFSCGWEGNVSECQIVNGGCWESGYYDINFCPNCGKEIDEYDMSKERVKEWMEWCNKKDIKHMFNDNLFKIE
jgi:hypothetical protein